MTAKHEMVRLYQLLSFPGYTLLLFIDPDDAKQERDQINRLIEYADNRLQVQVILNSSYQNYTTFKPVL